MIVEHLTVGPLGCTCTILGDEASGEAIVIDGGDDVDVIAERLAVHGLKPAALVHTHAHIDHIGALGELRARCGGAGLLHPADLPLYATLALQAQFLGLPIAPPIVAIDGDLRDGETLSAGALRLDVIHTPATPRARLRSRSPRANRRCSSPAIRSSAKASAASTSAARRWKNSSARSARNSSPIPTTPS
jgi:hypothetical protein